MALEVGALIEVEIAGLDDRGRGVVEASGRELLVPAAFPGERVRVRVEALARHGPRAHGRVDELLEASPARREPPCSRHELRRREPGDRRPKPSCGGCPLMPLELQAQRQAKRQWLERAHGLVLDQPIVGKDELGYRWSSKRVVSGRAGRLRVGSRSAGRRRGDHVADMRGCLVDHPRLRVAFDRLEDEANALGIEAWAGEGHGELRYVWAKTDGERVSLTLIGAAEASPALRDLGVRLHASGTVDGVAHSVQASVGNAIRGQAPEHLVGLEQLSLDLAGVELEVGPLGFLQPNPRVAALAYTDLIADPEGGELRGELAFDLYAGAGVTTALLGRRFAEVVPCESYPESAARLGVEPQEVAQMLRRWRERGGPRPELIVANPPRAGLGEDVCAELLAIGAPRVHVMSCSARTLTADLQRLRGQYELLGLRAYDTLPQTAHLELVAWLGR